MIATAFLLLPILTSPQDDAAGPAPSAGFDYTYISASYLSVDIDGLNEDVTGYAFGGSFELTESVFAFASMESSSIELLGVDLDLSVLSIGAGYHTPLSEQADFILSAAFLSAEAEVLGFTDDESGHALEAGVRLQASERVELNLGVGIVDIYDDSSSAFGLGAVVEVTNQVHATFGFQTAEDSDSLTVGVRFYPGG